MPEMSAQKTNIISKLSSEENNFFRYSLIIEYFGTNYSGSQVQPNQRTIQSELENAIEILTKHKTRVVLSGRTDSGVHAKYQVLHFDTSKELNERKFVNSMNGLLPDDISVKQLNKVENNFHSIKQANFRWYRYLINNEQHKNIWLSNITNHIRDNLSINEMNKAIKLLVGNHDFTSFKNTNSDNPASECEVLYANVRKKSGIIYIDLIANRFLYNMVRIIVGTLIEIGKGVQPAEHMLKVMQSKNRKLAGPTADSKGLILMYVGYDEKLKFESSIDMEANINEQNILCEAS